MLRQPKQRARNFSTFSVIGAMTNFIGPLVAGFSIDHLGPAPASAAIAALPLGGALVLLTLGARLPGGSGPTQSTPTSVFALLQDRGGMACGQPITTMLMFSRSAEGRSGEMLGLRLTANNLMRVAGPALFGLVASALGLASVFAINALMMLGGAVAARPQRKKRPG